MLTKTTPTLGHHIRKDLGRRIGQALDELPTDPMPPRMAAAFATLTGIQPAAKDDGRGTPGNRVTDDLARLG